jgi:hypothetical protein
MITLKEDTTLIGIAELRNRMSEVMKKIKTQDLTLNPAELKQHKTTR